MSEALPALAGSRPAPPLAFSSPYRHLMFVYGTLKRGENNYPYWLADPCHALFIGTARTCARYPFFVNLFPDYPGCSPNVLPMPVSDNHTRKPHAQVTGSGTPCVGATPVEHGDGASAPWQDRAEHVEGELFAVTEAMKQWLDVLEETESGVYAAIPTAVEPVQPSRSLMREVAIASVSAPQKQERWTIYELLVAPFLAPPSSPEGVLVASMYARMRDYPADWASAHPTSSSAFLRSFSAKSMLAAYGARFAGGLPAHHRSPAAAASMQRALDRLPPALQPPMSTANQRRRMAEVASQAVGGAPWSDYYYAAVDGALTGGGGADTPTDIAEDAELYVYGAPLLPKPMVLFVIDGVGDNTYPELGHRTPLEVVAGVAPRSGDAGNLPEVRRTLEVACGASQPPTPLPSSFDPRDCSGYVNEKINTITRAGVSGLMDPFLAGLSCGSDTAHLSLFGYNPEIYYRGRGAYETLGTTVDSSESDVDGAGEADSMSSASLTDDAANAAIRQEKTPNSEGVRFTLGDEDVCFKSNFATFADPDEVGFGDEDAELEARCAPLSGECKGVVEASAGRDGEPFNTTKAYFVTHRRCDRDFTREGPVLCRYLDNMVIDADVFGVPFEYPHVLRIKYATEHRCGVALSGARVVSMRAGATAGTGQSEESSCDAGEAPLAAESPSQGSGGGGCGVTKVVGVLSDKITGTDCLRDGLLLRKCVPTITRDADPVEYERAVYTCRLVEAASEKITRFLKVHRINEQRRRDNRAVSSTEGGKGTRKNVANLILFRGAAKKGWVPTFNNRHGLRGVMVAPTCIIKGLGVCCGLECKTICSVCFPSHIGRLQKRLRELRTDPPLSLPRVNATGRALEGATGDYHSDVAVKVAAGLHALRVRCPTASHHHARVAAIATAKGTDGKELVQHPHHNFLVIHVKGVDDAGHDANPREKLRLIGHCGDALADLFESLPEGSTVALIADHSTPLAIGDHSCEPVPVSVAVKRSAGPAPRADGVVGVHGRSLSEELACWQRWVRQQEPGCISDGGAGSAETTLTFNGRTFATVGDLVVCLLEEKATDSSLVDGTERYGEVSAAQGLGLGRFRGEELIGIMKRMSTYYHHM